MIISGEFVLGGLRFKDDYELEKAVTRWLITQYKDLLATGDRKDPHDMINDAVVTGKHGRK